MGDNSRSGYELLLLRRAAHRTLPGVWQPVTGGIEGRETAWQAAGREVREETGLNPRRWWALDAPTLIYEPARDTLVVLPLFAAELGDDDTPRLSSEHDRMAFVSPALARRRVHWISQRHAILALERQHFTARRRRAPEPATRSRRMH